VTDLVVVDGWPACPVCGCEASANPAHVPVLVQVGCIRGLVPLRAVVHRVVVLDCPLVVLLVGVVAVVTV